MVSVMSSRTTHCVMLHPIKQQAIHREERHARAQNSHSWMDSFLFIWISYAIVIVHPMSEPLSQCVVGIKSMSTTTALWWEQEDQRVCLRMTYYPIWITVVLPRCITDLDQSKYCFHRSKYSVLTRPLGAFYDDAMHAVWKCLWFLIHI